MSAAVLLSGGLDSAICLHWAIARHENVFAVSIDYGQRHLTELVSARRIAARARVQLLEVRAQIPWAPSSLTGGGTDVVVAGRNGILAHIAAAQLPNGGVVVMGCCADDAERFPDCRPAYLDALSSALHIALGAELLAPLMLLTKAEALRTAQSIPGALEAVALSWSCYDPQDAGARRPSKCGRCLACETRTRAFAELGEPDPAR